MDNLDNRRNPDDILSEILEQEKDRKSGRLKIFFGYAAGVGKTYAMLDDAQEQLKCGVDVLVGYVEPHTRPETMQLLHGLSALDPKTINYKNIELKEFNLEEALNRKPELILVDELAHNNAKGVRNKKRYQDIEELLNAGIDVYTTVNVQHIESLNDIVEDITKINVQETVPDYVFDRADKIKLIDIEPEELLNRFKEGKIYRPERATTAMNNFFTRDNLKLLREIAIRKVADRISNENQNERKLSEKMANTKLLVCIGPSPYSAKCIRWTARASEAFHAPWTAVYVENMDSESLSEQQLKTLRSNIDLAEKLGAEIITLTGHDIAIVIAEYAKLSGITNIVIGKSRNKKTLKNLFEMELEDKLISILPSIEVHIIPGSIVHKPYRNRSYEKPKKTEYDYKIKFSWQDNLKTFALLILSTLIGFALKKFNISEQNTIMVYILSVLVISRVTTGYMYGVISSILSVLTFNFFFTEPYFTFNAIKSGYPITFVIMMMVALITSALTVRIKKQARLAVLRERRTDILYEINKKLLSTRGLEHIVGLVNEYIVNIFERSAVIYTIDSNNKMVGKLMRTAGDLESTFMNEEDERAVAHWVFINNKSAGTGTDTLMGAGAFYIPVTSQGKVLATIGVSCINGELNHKNKLFLRMIASQLAMALERQNLSDEQKDILVASEKEKMRSNLLRAISHDLRTPLTGILGASSAILENEESIDKKTHDKLILNIKEDSEWLIRMVENLLSVTRINEGSMNVTKYPEAAEEIVAEAVSRVKNRFQDINISVNVPQELLIVPMDATLIVQVLMNLLENAVKHSKDNTYITVNLKKRGKLALFEVIDNGKGISEEDFPHLFESYMPSENKSADSTRGMGIGLSICMSIIKAHNGKIEAKNRKEGGAVFSFTLPLEGSKQ